MARNITRFKTTEDYETQKDVMLSLTRAVPGFSRYRVSKNGDVYRFYDKSKMYNKLKPRLNNSGYARIRLVSDNDRRKEYTVSRLVLITYCPTDDTSALTAHHKDRDKMNNALSNLEWLSEGNHNRLHSMEQRTPRSRGSHMNEDEKNLMIKMKREGSTIKQLSDFFDVRQRTIVDICKRMRFVAGSSC